MQHCREFALTLTSDGPRDGSTGRRSTRRENLRFCGLRDADATRERRFTPLPRDITSFLFSLARDARQIFETGILAAYVYYFRARYAWAVDEDRWKVGQQSKNSRFRLGKFFHASLRPRFASSRERRETERDFRRRTNMWEENLSEMSMILLIWASFPIFALDKHFLHHLPAIYLRSIASNKTISQMVFNTKFC